MRIRVLAILAVFYVLPARADPDREAAEPESDDDRCSVTIVRAPDRVRQEVERWVEAEPRCTGSLELRVVPTDGGFYLLARDERGRIRERIVPDARSVGVLVASWIADDAPVAPPARTPARRATPRPSPVVTPAPAPVAEAPVAEAAVAETPVAAAPGTPAPASAAAPVSAPAPASAPCAPGMTAPTPVPAPAPALAPMAPPVPEARLRAPGEPADEAAFERDRDTRSAGRWFTLGGTLNVGGDVSNGVRAEVDVVNRGRWTAGIAASLLQNLQDGMASSTSANAEVFLAGSLLMGRWAVRAQLSGGLGILSASYSDVYYWDYGGMKQRSVRPIASASLLLTRGLGERWALAAGPVVSRDYARDEFDIDFDDRPRQTVMMFAGFRRRL